VLSDHNRMQEGEFWYPIDSDSKTRALADYVRDFGSDWVEQRVVGRKDRSEAQDPGQSSAVSSKPRNEFIFIRGMEITDRLEQHPVHLNGVNLEKARDSQGGNTVTRDAAEEHRRGRRTGTHDRDVRCSRTSTIRISSTPSPPRI
jgi:hypothetical protein